MDAGEVLRQTSAVIGRPVTLWEVTGPHQAIPRATSSPGAPPPFDLDATLRRWHVPVPVGSLWVAALSPERKTSGSSRPCDPVPLRRRRADVSAAAGID